MPAWFVWAGIAIAGIGTTGWAVKEAGEAAESGAKLVKWGVAAGGLYVSYSALKSAGVLK